MAVSWLDEAPPGASGSSLRTSAFLDLRCRRLVDASPAVVFSFLRVGVALHKRPIVIPLLCARTPHWEGRHSGRCLHLQQICPRPRQRLHVADCLHSMSILEGFHRCAPNDEGCGHDEVVPARRSAQSSVDALTTLPCPGSSTVWGATVWRSRNTGIRRHYASASSSRCGTSPECGARSGIPAVVCFASVWRSSGWLVAERLRARQLELSGC